MDLCELGCGHPWDDHVLIATTGDPLDGGIIRCPVEDCECQGTWSVPQAEPYKASRDGKSGTTSD